MRKIIALVGACWLVFATAVAGRAGEGTNAGLSSDAAQVRDLQGRITGDPDLLALVMALQGDPEVQALLNDPRVMEAVLAGDYAPLLQDPRLQRLLQNARVKELGKRLDDQRLKK